MFSLVKNIFAKIYYQFKKITLMDSMLSKFIAGTSDQENYLIKSNNLQHPYFINFLEVYKTYVNIFPSEVNSWLENKMLLNKNTFDEKQFIQFASESTIVKYFADRYKANLFIEKKINPNNGMDVDLSFSHNGFTFNIEVKCSDFNSKELVDSRNTLKIQPIGRIPNFPEELAELQKLLQPVADKMNLDGIESAKNMDNNLKDFLLSADSKFNPASPDNELNVLAVCCDDAEDMQLWYYYMYKDQGLFTTGSFWNQSKFENVDLVLLNNLYFKHNKFFNKKLQNSWDFSTSFNLIFENPFAKLKKTEAIKQFLQICPNLNTEFRTWNMPGSAEEVVKDSRRIADFIKAELESNREIFLFEQP